MAKLCHTGAHRGKKVFIILKDGTQFIDRFIDRDDRHVYVQERGRIKKSDIKSFSARPVPRGGPEHGRE